MIQLVPLLALAALATSAPRTAELPERAARSEVAGDSTTVFIVDVRLHVRPDSETAFLEAAGPFLERARASEGNLDFQLVSFAGVPHRYALLERWRSEGALEAFRSTDVFQTFRSEVGPFLAGPPEPLYYEAAVAGQGAGQ